MPISNLLFKTSEKKGKNTTIIQNHHATSYGLIVKPGDDVPIELLEQFEIPTTPIIYRGSKEENNVAQKFVQCVTEIAVKVRDMLKTNKIIMNDDEQRAHKLATICNLCKVEYSKKNIKVADHNHLSSRFRQSLCNNCNLKLQSPSFIPCFLHNESNYDNHFIITKLGYDAKTISVIPNSEEKFISFSKYISKDFSVRYIDTYRFMSSSLSTLALNLLTNNFENYHETAKVFNSTEMPLVTRKGVYPYDYTDSWDKLEENSLPPINRFYSILNEGDITDED